MKDKKRNEQKTEQTHRDEIEIVNGCSARKKNSADRQNSRKPNPPRKLSYADIVFRLLLCDLGLGSTYRHSTQWTTCISTSWEGL